MIKCEQPAVGFASDPFASHVFNDSVVYNMHSFIQRADAAMPPMRPDINMGPTILKSTLTVTSVALVSTIARFYVRIWMIRNVGWDVGILRRRSRECPLTICLLGLCNAFGNGSGTAHNSCLLA